MTLTWNTAAEWDAAQSQDGVIHEATTDLSAADVQPGPSPSLNGIVGLWPMDEDSDTAAVTDLVAGRDATNNGAGAGVAGVLNTTSYSMAGSGGYLSVSDAAAFDLSTFTVAAWIEPTAESHHRAINAHDGGVSPGERNWWFGLRDSSESTNPDHLHFAIGNESGSKTTVTGGTALTMNTWNHVAATYDGAAMTVYLNGSSDASTSTSITPATSSSSVGFGATYDSGAASWKNFYGGEMAWQLIANRAFSASEVSTLASGDGTLTTAKKVS